MKRIVIPSAGLSLVEAQEFCAAEGKRLCTSAEWRHVCMGKERLRYGYGPEQYLGLVTCHLPNLQHIHP